MASNLNIDSHKDLDYWEDFFDHLKNFEALLKISERRERFIWTCVRNTQFQTHWACKKVKRFKGSLYEKKLKYVTKFIGKLMKILFLFI